MSYMIYGVAIKWQDLTSLPIFPKETIADAKTPDEEITLFLESGINFSGFDLVKFDRTSLKLVSDLESPALFEKDIDVESDTYVILGRIVGDPSQVHDVVHHFRLPECFLNIGKCPTFYLIGV